MQVDLDRLRIVAPQLHDALARHIGYKTGVREVADFSGINPPEIRLPLFDWAQRDEWTQKREKQKAQDEEFQKRLATVKNEKAAPLPTVEQAPVEKPAEPRVTIDFEQTLREEAADLQRRADEGAGRNRLNQYASEQGLEDTHRNADHIKQWLADNVKGYVSEKGIDLAIQCLGPRGKNVLTWRPKEAPAPPPPAQEPVEVLGTLPDGSRQLPLDVDQFTLRRASKDQARDWLKRTNAGKIIRPSGSFRSSIF